MGFKDFFALIGVIGLIEAIKEVNKYQTVPPQIPTEEPRQEQTKQEDMEKKYITSRAWYPNVRDFIRRNAKKIETMKVHAREQENGIFIYPMVKIGDWVQFRFVTRTNSIISSTDAEDDSYIKSVGTLVADVSPSELREQSIEIQKMWEIWLRREIKESMALKSAIKSTIDDICRHK